jgi:hypothetical protein
LPAPGGRCDDVNRQVIGNWHIRTSRAMVIGNGRLTPGDRGEILAAALCARHAPRRREPERGDRQADPGVVKRDGARTISVQQNPAKGKGRSASIRPL